DDVQLVARVAEAVEYLQGSLRAAYRGNVEREDEKNLVRLVERGERDGVEGVLRVDDDVLVSLAQDFENLEDVLGLYVVGGVGLARRGQERQALGVRRQVAPQQLVVDALAVLDKVGDGELRLDAE